MHIAYDIVVMVAPHDKLIIDYNCRLIANSCNHITDNPPFINPLMFLQNNHLI